MEFSDFLTTWFTYVFVCMYNDHKEIWIRRNGLSKNIYTYICMYYMHLNIGKVRSFNSLFSLRWTYKKWYVSSSNMFKSFTAFYETHDARWRFLLKQDLIYFPAAEAEDIKEITQTKTGCLLMEVPNWSIDFIIFYDQWKRLLSLQSVLFERRCSDRDVSC